MSSGGGIGWPTGGTSDQQRAVAAAAERVGANPDLDYSEMAVARAALSDVKAAATRAWSEWAARHNIRKPNRPPPDGADASDMCICGGHDDDHYPPRADDVAHCYCKGTTERDDTACRCRRLRPHSCNYPINPSDCGV